MSDASPQPATGSIETAIAHARRLLASAPELAAEQADEILKVAPGHPVPVLLVGMARRMMGQPGRALELLEPLAAAQPRWAEVHYECGLALAEVGRADLALAVWRHAVALDPNLAEAWGAIGDLLHARGDEGGASAAYARQIKASTKDPRLVAAATALCANAIPEAETLLREHLKRHPTDVAAIRMFAEVAGRLGRYRDAQNLLERCLELAPDFHAARHNYAVVLNRQHKIGAAIDQVERLLAADRHNPAFRNLRAVVMAKLGEYRESIEIYAQLLAAHPHQAPIWISYGHALAGAGRESDAVAAYRRAISLSPGSGEAYWSLANLKTFRFSEAELAAMQAQLEREDLTDAERCHFEFAIGKALEDVGRYQQSFEHYAAGNRQRRQTVGYDPEDNAEHVRRSKQLFSREFFASRRGFGTPRPDPIFIVGLPRAGSTLVEQILASHSAVEGTAELPDIIAIARGLSGRKSRGDASQYPEVLATATDADCRGYGEEYLERTRIQRKTDKPLFIDKMPNNFLHIGLIHLALPNARIIDARRHPLACCFSGFKQHFASGQNYTYSLEEIGRYYRDYVHLMAHVDRVLPGRVHRVIYESMVEDTEGEVRRLLEYCGLPFEPACLRFHENERAVRTASAQQVRRPIFREGVDQWRHFEPWLEPLKEALGPVLAAYPDAPSL